MSCPAPVGLVEGIGSVASGCEACLPRRPADNWFQAAKIAMSTIGIGSWPTIDLGAVDARDRFGRHGHVTAIRLRGTYRVTLAAANAVVPGFDFFSVFANVQLQDFTKWMFFSSVDGRDIRDDQWMRMLDYGASNAPVADIPLNAGAGNVDREVVLTIPLVDWTQDGRNRKAMRGSIPLIALQRNAQEALRVQVGTPGNGFAYAGVTNVGFVGDLYVELQVLYTKPLIVAAPWQLESYELAQPNGALFHLDREHEYATIRYLTPGVVAAPGAMDLDDFTNYTLQANGEEIFSGLTFAELRQRDLAFLQSVLDSDGTQLYATGVGAASAAALLSVQRATDSESAAAGAIQYKLTRDAVRHPTIRWLHRTTACDRGGSRAAKIAEAAACTVGGSAGYTPCMVAPDGRAVQVSSPTAPIAMLPPGFAMGSDVRGSGVGG